MSARRQLLILVVLACALGLGWADEEHRGHFSYHSWKSGSGSHLGEGVHVYTSDRRSARTDWLLVTPDENRVLLSELYDPREDRWTTRFTDLEGDWWAEEGLDSTLSYEDMRDHIDDAFRRFVEEKPPLDLSIRTADGLALHETFAWKELEPSKRTRDTTDLIHEWAESDEHETLDLPASTVEAISFLIGLREAEALGEDELIVEASHFLEALLVAQREVADAPGYMDMRWTEGEIQRSRTPAVSELLDRFDNEEEAKHSVRWVRRNLPDL